MERDQQRIRVLVADDDPTILRLVETALPLAAPDIEVVGTAAGPDSLVEAIEELEPDLVMVDHHLDKASGVEIGRRLRSRAQGPVLVLWTGTSTVELQESAAEAGFSSVVEKSADLEGLAQTIREAARGGRGAS